MCGFMSDVKKSDSIPFAWIFSDQALMKNVEKYGNKCTPVEAVITFMAAGVFVSVTRSIGCSSPIINPLFIGCTSVIAVCLAPSLTQLFLVAQKNLSNNKLEDSKDFGDYPPYTHWS